jgi:hypothetical protein
VAARHLRRMVRIAKLTGIGIGVAFCGLVLLVMLVITFSPNQ